MVACTSPTAWPPRKSASSSSEIVRWFRELQYYGFIVMQKPGGLGVYGKGQAPRWRLTELGYMKDPPTRDFMRWNGVRSQNQGDTKKQKPARKTATGCHRKTGDTRHGKPCTYGKARKTGTKRAGQSAPENRDKSSNHLGGAWVGDHLRGETPPGLTIIEGDKAPPEQCPSRNCAHCGGNGEPLFKFKYGLRPVWLHRLCRRHWLAHEAAS